MRGAYAGRLNARDKVVRRAARDGRRAFTLVEMLVSLAVMSLALGIVGVVFTITTETASQAAAYSDTQNWVRQFGMQLEEDLRHCEPSSGILVLVGRTQAAALTTEELEAQKYYRVLLGDPDLAAGYDPEFDRDVPPGYSDPRADLLMFFSNRPTVSKAPPDAPLQGTWGELAANGTKFAPIQVVYGHAALASTRGTGPGVSFDETSLRHIEEAQGGGFGAELLSRIPASQWHLARRATMLVDEPGVSDGKLVFSNSFVGDEWERIARCMPQDGINPPMPGDLAYLDLNALLRAFSPASPITLDATGPVLYSPYNFYGTAGGFGSMAPWDGQFQLIVENLMYVNGVRTPRHHVATVLDTVPVELRENLGVQMLPGCAWFQVEFLMPEDPRNSIAYTNPDPDSTLYTDRSAPARWTAVRPGETYVFVPDTQENRAVLAVNPRTGQPSTRLVDTFARLDQEVLGGDDLARPETIINSRVIRTWPYAIRVTVRVFDSRGRLPEPIVRSFVHRFE